MFFILHALTLLAGALNIGIVAHQYNAHRTILPMNLVAALVCFGVAAFGFLVVAR